ncbi:MAG: four-helix bundle copper-binding protein, partial [Longimicrobiales bacterium]
MSRLKKMLDTHPDPAGSNGAEALRCIEACMECSEMCTVCADACLAERDVQALVTCIRLNLDCAEVCRVTGTLMTRPSHRDAPALRAQLHACVEICRACGDECAGHAHMKHCAVCAE